MEIRLTPPAAAFAVIGFGAGIVSGTIPSWIGWVLMVFGVGLLVFRENPLVANAISWLNRIFHGEVSYMTAYEALSYFVEGSRYNAASEEFSKRASEGKVKVYGYSAREKRHVGIPADYWLSHMIDTESLEDEDINGRTTPSTFVSVMAEDDDSPVYTDLRVEASGVRVTWPKRNGGRYGDR